MNTSQPTEGLGRQACATDVAFVSADTDPTGAPGPWQVIAVSQPEEGQWLSGETGVLRGEEVSDVVLSYVFSANLATQEVTGDIGAAMSVEAVVYGLQPSPQGACLMYALINAEPELADGHDAGAQLGGLDVFEVPVLGDERNFDYLGFVLVTVPNVNNPLLAEVAITLDAGIAPLPGQPLDTTARLVMEKLVRLGEEVARVHGRTIIQTGLLSVDSERDPKASLLRELGYRLAYRAGVYAVDLDGALDKEQAYPLPEGCRLRYFTGAMPPADMVEDLCRLLDIADRDVPHGSLTNDPQPWTPQRLQAIAAREQRRGSFIMTAVVEGSDDPASTGSAGNDHAHRRLIAMSSLSHDPGASREMVAQDLTVVAPPWRGRGLATATKAGLWRRLREIDGGVRRVGTTLADDNSAIIAVNSHFGARLLAHEIGWELITPLHEA